MLKRLKSCPFCGGQPFIHEIEPHKHILADLPDYEGSAHISCTDCSCELSERTRKEAITAWNKRI